MKKVKITIMRRSVYPDLIEKYENPIEHPCEMKIGDVYIANGWNKPEGFCTNAWDCISQFVMALSCGATGLYDNWMRNERSAFISCNDGFRPVSFMLETLDEQADNL